MQPNVVGCPYCSGLVALDTRLASLNVSCPHCSRGFVMPSLTSRAFTGAEDVWGGLIQGETALPPHELTPRVLTDPVYQMHLNEVVPMADAFLATPVGCSTPDQVEFKILPEITKRITELQRQVIYWQAALGRLRTREAEVDRVRREIAVLRAKFHSDPARLRELTRADQKQADLLAAMREPGVTDRQGSQVVGNANLKREVERRLSEVSAWMTFYQQKYQEAADILNNPANGKFVPQLPGQAFAQQGKYEEDPSTMQFDADGIYWIPDGKGGRVPYLYKDPKNPGATPRLHPHQTGGAVRRFLRTWLGI